MEIAKVTVAQIFEKPRRYLVPLFQRRYVWSAEGQWQPLWEDILEQAEAVSAAKESHQAPPRQHFMGAVVLGRETSSIKQVPVSLLVDGQQRLTTVTIILAALRDVSALLGNTFLEQTLHRLVANPEPLTLPLEQYKVWPTQGDQPAFVDALNMRSEDGLLEKYPVAKKIKKTSGHRPALVEAYLFFSRAIRAYLEDRDFRPPHLSGGPDHLPFEGPAKEWMSQRAEILLDAVTRHLQLVAIELDQEEDPQVIFETLNARGVPLLPSDLIRNFLFLVAQRQGESIEELYERFWLGFDTDWKAPGEKDSFWQERIKQGRYRRPRIDLFLFHYTTLITVQDIRLEHLFTEYRAWWSKPFSAAAVPDGRSVPAELARLARHALHFRRLQLPDPGTRVGQFAQRLKALDTSTVYPIVLALLDRAKSMGEAETYGFLTDLESYLVRRMVCGLTTKGYNRIFLSLLRRLLEANDFRHDKLRSELRSLAGVSDVWPSDESFHKAWMSTPIYESLGPAKTRMLLEALEQAQRGPKQEFQILPDVITIEHLLPQNPQPGDYPYPNGSVAVSSIQNQAGNRHQCLHSLGNLTLLTDALNKSVSNGPWYLKRPEIAVQSQLRLNAYFQQSTVLDGWDEAQIEERGNHLFEHATKLWPGPKT